MGSIFSGRYSLVMIGVVVLPASSQPFGQIELRGSSRSADTTSRISRLQLQPASPDAEYRYSNQELPTTAEVTLPWSSAEIFRSQFRAPFRHCRHCGIAVAITPTRPIEQHPIADCAALITAR